MATNTVIWYKTLYCSHWQGPPQGVSGGDGHPSHPLLARARHPDGHRAVFAVSHPRHHHWYFALAVRVLEVILRWWTLWIRLGCDHDFSSVEVDVRTEAHLSHQYRFSLDLWVLESMNTLNHCWWWWPRLFHSILCHKFCYLTTKIGFITFFCIMLVHFLTFVTD